MTDAIHRSTDNKSRAARESFKPIKALKTLDWRLAVSDGDPSGDIKRAFDLAKSSGQELNLTFSAAAAVAAD